MTQPSRCLVLARGRVRYHGHIYEIKKLRPRTWQGAMVIVAAFPGTRAVVLVHAAASYRLLGLASCRRLWRATGREKRAQILAAAKSRLAEGRA